MLTKKRMMIFFCFRKFIEQTFSIAGLSILNPFYSNKKRTPFYLVKYAHEIFSREAPEYIEGHRQG